MSALAIGAAERAGVDALAARFELPGMAAARLLELLELVACDPTAPTAVRDPETALRDHLADALVALELPELPSASSLADIGSGAGFPGLPLAIALPRAQIHLVESNGRKCEFIRRAIAATGLRNAFVVHARAESWTGGRGGMDVVTARAVAPLPVLAEYAAPLLRVGGSLVAWRGRRDPEGEAAAARAGAELGLQMREPASVRPYREAANRHLHLMTKVSDTPPRFPRRPGAAAKRPLGGV